MILPMSETANFLVFIGSYALGGIAMIWSRDLGFAFYGFTLGYACYRIWNSPSKREPEENKNPVNPHFKQD
jgi:hypothetical protein